MLATRCAPPLGHCAIGCLLLVTVAACSSGATNRASESGGNSGPGSGGAAGAASTASGGAGMSGTTQHGGAGGVVTAGKDDAGAVMDVNSSVDLMDMGSPRDASSESSSPPMLAATPPMGWNSWNAVQCNPTDALIRGIADAFVSSGMQSVGYQYVNIDDCWSAGSRDASGNLVPDPAKFPNGMKSLVDYVHGKGLKIGIYGDRGSKTCNGRPGSAGYEVQDAQTWATWGIDYVKYDNCNVGARTSSADMQADYEKMARALKATGRPMIFSICAWQFYDWMPKVGHLWRTTDDIRDEWKRALELVDQNGEWKGRNGGVYNPPGIAQYSGPGHWNDPDMLEVGNGGMSDTEYRSHFSLWAIMAAPLLAGNDLRNLKDAAKAILTNADVIAVDQDPLGIQGKPISADKNLEVWSKQLVGNQTYAVALFNRTGATADITVTWSDLGLTSSGATVRDLWSHTDLGASPTQYKASVPSHGVAMLKVVGI